jgi:hypothetical protein
MTDNIKTLEVEQLQAAVVCAVGNLLRYDSTLVEMESHEQAISHRLAVHLERLLIPHASVHVDCEYNMHLFGEKKARIEPQYYLDTFPGCGCNSCNKLDNLDDIEEKEFRPDIIVHTRGTDSGNLIALELKKKARVCPFDLSKLRALTSPKVGDLTYGYRLGGYLQFHEGRPRYVWLMHGEIMK